MNHEKLFRGTQIPLICIQSPALISATTIATNTITVAATDTSLQLLSLLNIGAAIPSLLLPTRIRVYLLYDEFVPVLINYDFRVGYTEHIDMKPDEHM